MAKRRVRNERKWIDCGSMSRHAQWSPQTGVIREPKLWGTGFSYRRPSHEIRIVEEKEKGGDSNATNEG